MARWSLTFLACFFCVAGLAQPKQTLVVYYPSTIKAAYLEARITECCPKYDVRAFDTSNALRRFVKIQQPAAMLAPALLIDHTRQFAPTAQGVRGAATHEKTFLLSVDASVNLAQAARLRLGVLDLLGQRDSQKYVDGLLGGTAKIARAAKTEDLAAMLALGMADALLVPEGLAEMVTSRTPMPWRRTVTDIKSQLVVGANLQGASGADKKALQACVERFDDQLNTIFGVESWQLAE